MKERLEVKEKKSEKKIRERLFKKEKVTIQLSVTLERCKFKRILMAHS